MNITSNVKYIELAPCKKHSCGYAYFFKSYFEKLAWWIKIRFHSAPSQRSVDRSPNKNRLNAKLTHMLFQKTQVYICVFQFQGHSHENFTRVDNLTESVHY